MGIAADGPYGAHVRANGIRQHYLRYPGPGPSLVLLPGIISPAALWGPVGERLGRRFDAYVLDVRGRGLSESGPHLDYGLDACATDVAAFCDALALDDVVLVGHSMGARIAARAMRRGGGSVRRLVLVDPPVSGPGRRPYPTTLDDMLEIVAAARAVELDALLRRRQVAPWPEPQQRLRVEWTHTCDERAVATSHRDFHEQDFHADLVALDVPTLLMTAARGGVIGADDIDEIGRLAPAIRVVTVPDAGHQIAIDNPEGFYAALGAYLGVDLGVELGAELGVASAS